MQRLRLFDCRMSRLPELVGLCQANITDIANIVNSAQRRLIYAKEAGEEATEGGAVRTRIGGRHRSDDVHQRGEVRGVGVDLKCAHGARDVAATPKRLGRGEDVRITRDDGR